MRKAKIRELYKDYELLRKQIEKNLDKLGLSLEDELLLFSRLDNIKRLLDKISEMCYNK